MSNPIQKENISQLVPENQFPKEAIQQSVQIPATVTTAPPQGPLSLILTIATATDLITPWGVNTQRRDAELRQFWPTEPFLAGAVVSASLRNAAYDWQIESTSERLSQAVTEMLHRAVAGDKVGWLEFAKKFSQDLYCTDNGAFIELIRDEGMDANSKFKGEMAPVIGISHLDSNQCMRTGNAETPVIYRDREGGLHKLKWYEVITFSDYPSSIEKMNGVGYCAVTRVMRLAQIMKSSQLLKDEMISGRNSKDINVVSGVSRTDIDDAVKRTQEQASNKGNLRYVDNVVLASLDPEKPVSVATISLAGFPDGFSLNEEMEWYVAGLALNLGTDYQDLAPLPGGNIGSSAQSETLSRKSSGKGPRNWMDSITESFKTYGVIPRNTKMVFNDKNEQEELEKQNVRTKAMEEAAIAANAKIFPRKFIAMDLVARGLYPEMKEIPPSFWVDEEPATKQPVGDRGGNTIAEDAKRQDTGKTSGKIQKEAIQNETILVRTLEGVLSFLKKDKSDNMNINIHNHPGKPANVYIEPSETIIKNYVQPTPVKNYVQSAPISFNPTIVPSKVNVDVRPQVTAPSVTINNLIKKAKEAMPKIKRVVGTQTVHRDEEGIKGTKTVETYEYEE